MMAFRPIDSAVDIIAPAALMEGEGRVAAKIVLRNKADLDRYIEENAGALTVDTGTIDWSREVVVGTLIALRGCTGESEFTEIRIDNERAEIQAILNFTETGECDGLLLVDRWVTVENVSADYKITVSLDVN